MSSPETEAAAGAPEGDAAEGKVVPAGEAADAKAIPSGEAATVLEALSSELGAAVLGSAVQGDDLWVRVGADEWRRSAEVCRSLGFDYFCFLSGIDWMPHTWPNPGQQGESPAEAADVPEGEAGFSADDPGPERPLGAGDDASGDQPAEPAAETPGWPTGLAGGDTRYQVLARLHSIKRKLGVILKADLDDDQPRVESWTSVYPGADWHERETWEMYGFDFVGHPNLIHLYLPSEFEGFPLRKDFPLLAREVKPWPGLVDPEPMPPGLEGDGADGSATADDAAAAEGP